MENCIVFKNREMAKMDSSLLGVAGENEQEILVFSFENGFIDGTCFLELEFPDGKKYSIRLEKGEECYRLVVKKSLLKMDGMMRMQLKLISNGTEIWKSLIFEMLVMEAINATESIEEDYKDFATEILTRLQDAEVGLEQVAEKVQDIDVLTNEEIDKIIKV